MNRNFWLPIVVTCDYLTIDLDSELTEEFRDPAVFDHMIFIDLNCTSDSDRIFSQITVRIFVENKLKQVTVVTLWKVFLGRFFIQHDTLHI